MAHDGWLGLPPQGLAVLMIVFGLLIILLPALLPWLVGILLIVIGVSWLVGASGAGSPWSTRRRAGPPRRI